jgi:hypothetical protein
MIKLDAALKWAAPDNPKDTANMVHLFSSSKRSGWVGSPASSSLKDWEWL